MRAIKRNKNIVRWITGLLFFLFVGQVANKALYTHSHILNDGTIVHHSHPFQKSNDQGPLKSHFHSILELAFLEHLDLVFPFVLTPFVFFVKWDTGYLKMERRNTYFHASIPVLPGRSPPASPNYLTF